MLENNFYVSLSFLVFSYNERLSLEFDFMGYM